MNLTDTKWAVLSFEFVPNYCADGGEHEFGVSLFALRAMCFRGRSKILATNCLTDYGRCEGFHSCFLYRSICRTWLLRHSAVSNSPAIVSDTNIGLPVFRYGTSIACWDWCYKSDQFLSVLVLEENNSICCDINTICTLKRHLVLRTRSLAPCCEQKPLRHAEHSMMAKQSFLPAASLSSGSYETFLAFLSGFIYRGVMLCIYL